MEKLKHPNTLVNKVSYPVYEECKTKMTALLKPLEMSDSIRGALMRRMGILVGGTSEILAMLSVADGDEYRKLSSAEAVNIYRRKSGIRARSGAFLEMGLDSLFRALFLDFKEGWKHIKNPVELSLELGDYVAKLKAEKKKNNDQQPAG